MNPTALLSALLAVVGYGAWGSGKFDRISGYAWEPRWDFTSACLIVLRGPDLNLEFGLYLLLDSSVSEVQAL